MKSKAKKTAGEAHAKAMGDALILLKMIRKELIAQAQADREEGIHWAHVGSAEHYRTLLKEALMQMKVVDDEEATMREIEKEIAAARGK